MKAWLRGVILRYSRGPFPSPGAREGCSRGMKELTGPDTAPAFLELSVWLPYATLRPLQFTTVEGSMGPGLRRLAREGPEPTGLGGSLWALKSRGPGGASEANPSEQYQSLPSFNKTEMLNQYADGQDVMLTKHIPTTRTILFNNKTLIGPLFSSTV